MSQGEDRLTYIGGCLSSIKTTGRQAQAYSREAMRTSGVWSKNAPLAG